MWCTPDSAFGHLAAGAGRAGRAARTDAPVPAAARMASREGGAGGLLVLLVLLVLLDVGGQRGPGGGKRWEGRVVCGKDVGGVSTTVGL